LLFNNKKYIFLANIKALHTKSEMNKTQAEGSADSRQYSRGCVEKVDIF